LQKRIFLGFLRVCIQTIRRRALVGLSPKKEGMTKIESDLLERLDLVLHLRLQYVKLEILKQLLPPFHLLFIFLLLEREGAP
jgi:hypothetical protein